VLYNIGIVITARLNT